MIERLNALLAHPSKEVIDDPKLLMELLRLWSMAFNGRKPCSTCRKDHVKYYADLQTKGILIFEKMDKQLFLLKSNTCIQTTGKIYRVDNTSDDDAVRLLKRNPKLIKEFQKFPEDWKELVNVLGEEPVKVEPVIEPVEKVEAPVEVKKKRTRKPKA